MQSSADPRAPPKLCGAGRARPGSTGRCAVTIKVCRPETSEAFVARRNSLETGKVHARISKKPYTIVSHRNVLDKRNYYHRYPRSPVGGNRSPFPARPPPERSRKPYSSGVSGPRSPTGRGRADRLPGIDSRERVPTKKRGFRVGPIRARLGTTGARRYASRARRSRRPPSRSSPTAFFRSPFWSVYLYAPPACICFRVFFARVFGPLSFSSRPRKSL